jgi:hypothetical protein
LFRVTEIIHLFNLFEDSNLRKLSLLLAKD